MSVLKSIFVTELGRVWTGRKLLQLKPAIEPVDQYRSSTELLLGTKVDQPKQIGKNKSSEKKKKF